MSSRIDPRQVQAAFAASPQKRLRHFLNELGQRRTAWALYEDGFALATDPDGSLSLPLWPAMDYAAACALDAWTGYEPEELGLDELVYGLLPRLESEGVRVAVMHAPDGSGLSLAPSELRGAICEYFWTNFDEQL